LIPNQDESVVRVWFKGRKLVTLVSVMLAMAFGMLTGLVSPYLRGVQDEDAYSNVIGLSSNQEGTATMLRSPVSLTDTYEMHADYDGDGTKEWNIVVMQEGSWRELGIHIKSYGDSEKLEALLVELGGRVGYTWSDSDGDQTIDQSQFFITSEISLRQKRVYSDRNLDGLVDTAWSLDENGEKAAIWVMVEKEWALVTEMVDETSVLCKPANANESKLAVFGDAGWDYKR
jgi:hypothetical protein